MDEILHRITIENSPHEVYRALTEQRGLSAWWTRAQAKPQAGSMARFVFGPNDEHVVEMAVTRLVPDRQVVWRCVTGPWVDTDDFTFDIEPHERGAVLDFSHRRWPEADSFYRHCNSKWGFFLGVSLKRYLETGQGLPSPQDPAI